MNYNNTEDTKRKTLFMQRRTAIKTHNLNPKRTYNQTYNQFTDKVFSYYLIFNFKIFDVLKKKKLFVCYLQTDAERAIFLSRQPQPAAQSPTTTNLQPILSGSVI